MVNTVSFSENNINLSNSQRKKNNTAKKLKMILINILQKFYLKFVKSSFGCYLEDIFADKSTLKSF